MSDAPAALSPALDPRDRRAAVRLLEEAGAALGVRVETFCQDWAVRLTHADGRTRLVWGYHFDLNPSAGALVAKDKPAAFEILRAAGVPAVEHRLFLRADLEGYVPEAGNWRALLAAFEAFGCDAVIKPTDGSGGAGVSRVRTNRELERAAQGLWERTHAICLSPFLPVRREVRHVLLDGEAWMVYEKQIEALVGDGRSTVAELLATRARAELSRADASANGGPRVRVEMPLAEVPAAGERVALGWKHNLRGARPVLLDPPPPAMLAQAKHAADALGLRLCAADVIEVAGRPEPLVLEVNAGLMLERFVDHAPDGWSRGLSLCTEVVRRLFNA